MRDRIVASLVRAQPRRFLLNILKWLLVAIPATLTNSWLTFIQNRLSLAYRTRLTEKVMQQYLGDDAGQDDKIFYKLGTLRRVICYDFSSEPCNSEPGRPHQECRPVRARFIPFYQLNSVVSVE